MNQIINEYTTLSQWGNSKATRISTSVNIDVNQKFSISIQGESIVLTPEVKQPNTIHKLFSNWKDDGIRHKELDWGGLKEMKESIKVGIIYFIILLKQRFSTIFSFFFFFNSYSYYFTLFYISPIFLRFILLF